MMGTWKDRENQHIQLAKVLYCKLPTSGKQLPDVPYEVRPRFELRSQRWEASVLPIHRRAPLPKHCIESEP